MRESEINQGVQRYNWRTPSRTISRCNRSWWCTMFNIVILYFNNVILWKLLSTYLKLYSLVEKYVPNDNNKYIKEQQKMLWVLNGVHMNYDLYPPLIWARNKKEDLPGNEGDFNIGGLFSIKHMKRKYFIRISSSYRRVFRLDFSVRI